MASPAVTRDTFQRMQQNAAETAQLAQQHQIAMGVISADQKVASTNTKTSMASVNETANLVTSPLNEAFKG